jgi:NAD(P)H-quinone oxidoreductase subunit 5
VSAALAAPAILLLGALLPLRGGRAAEWVARLSALSAAFAALACALAWHAGAAHATLNLAPGFGIGVRLDILSCVMLMLVSFLGSVVTRFSVNYLDGDPGRARFSRWLAATIAAVSLMVIAPGLAQLAAAWIATSLCLHQLLTFYRERPEAMAAARKKFVISRAADLAILGAVGLIWRSAGTLDFQDLFQAGLPAGTNILLPSLLLVLAALMKSAQVPFHSWLPDTLETPTPVSALMHAGIINGGGFLIVRMSPLLAQSPAALNLLALAGAVSALFASVVMMTQTSIKRALAWSTVAQMGFMMLECGLGAFGLAVLHIVAHSLYKSHAFLSSGSVVAITRAAWTPTGRPQAHPFMLACILAITISLTWLAGSAVGASFAADPGSMVLVSIFVMALGFMLWNLWNTRFPNRLAVAGVLIAAVLAFAWAGLHQTVHGLFAAEFPGYTPRRSPVELAVMALVVLLFLSVLLFQAWLPALAHRAAFRALYIHASNGFYLDSLLSRLRRPLRLLSVRRAFTALSGKP